MTGYMTLVFVCANCGRPGSANPSLVLSIPASWDEARGQFMPDPEGARQPVCRACAETALQRVFDKDPNLTYYPPILADPEYLERAYGGPGEVE
jgi:hypothetical protein